MDTFLRHEHYCRIYFYSYDDGRVSPRTLLAMIRGR